MGWGWAKQFPRRLLSEACGCFPDEGLPRAEVDATIHRRKQEIREEDPEYDVYWQPEEIVLGAGRVLAIYGTDPVGGEERFFLLDLRSDNGESFTAGELFYKLYRAAAAEVRSAYHCWFEGLELVTTMTTQEGSVPLYRVWLAN